MGRRGNQSIQVQEDKQLADCKAEAQRLANSAKEEWIVIDYGTGRQWRYWSYSATTLREYPLQAPHRVVFRATPKTEPSQ